MFSQTRRDFFRTLGLSAAAMPFVLNLPSLGFANQAKRKQRLVIMFSPNGVVPWNFWPDETGAGFSLKSAPVSSGQKFHGTTPFGLNIITRRCMRFA